MKKLVIFDLDGTLLYTLEDICGAVNYALVSVEMPLRMREEIHGFINNGTRKLIERSLGRFANDELVDRCLEAYTRYYNKNYANYTRPYEGITECVDRLIESDVACAVVTNKFQEAADSLCEKFFPNKFAFIKGGVEGSPHKPDPTRVFEIIKALDADEVVLVGDSYVDIETAKNANIPCVALTWGYNSKAQLEDAGAKLYAKNANELWEHLVEILKI